MAPSDLHETFRFHDFELDVGAYQLRRNGRPVRIERQPMDLLILLVRSRRQLLSRDEIAERLWGKDVFVDVETGVHTAIRKIRQALRDSPDAPVYVETVSGKGYRFIAPVDTVPVRQTTAPSAPSAPEPAPPHRAARIVGGALAVVLIAGLVTWALRGARPLPPRVTVAVLPFENLSGESEREYLADGLAEETIASFGQIDPERVGVIGRRSTAAYKGARKSLADIGRELGADYLVEGSIRSEAGRLFITSRLVRVRDQTQVWSASYDREPTSVIALQRELSTAMAEQIRLRLSPERLEALSRRHTRNADAYDLFLRGRHFWNQLTPPTNARAVEYYERAIALDPNYALAWAGIANAFVGMTMNSDVPPSAASVRAREAAERSVRAQPDLSDAQSALGYVRFFLDWEWPAAEAAFRRATTHDPGSAVAHRLLGHVLSQMGRPEEAAESLRRARTLEPLYAMNHAISSQVAFQGRDFPAALTHARQAIVVDPEFWIGYMELGQVYEQLGQRELALEAFLSAARFSGGNSKAVSHRGFVLGRMGRRDEARAVLTTLEALSRERYVPPYALGLVHAGLGERDATLDALDRAFEARDVHLIFLTVDPKWDSYRGDPRFQAVLARCGFLRPAGARPQKGRGD